MEQMSFRLEGHTSSLGKRRSCCLETRMLQAGAAREIQEVMPEEAGAVGGKLLRLLGSGGGRVVGVAGRERWA